VHRPYWVQEHDPDNQHRVVAETHWHIERDCWDPQTRRWLVERHRPCDIDEPGPVRRCQRYLAYNTCGCTICTGQYDRKQTRRRERGRLRADLREAVKTSPANWGDIDIVEPRRVTCWVSYGNRTRGGSS